MAFKCLKCGDTVNRMHAPTICTECGNQDTGAIIRVPDTNISQNRKEKLRVFLEGLKRT